MQYIATQSLLDICEAMGRTPGVQVGERWWDQAGINLTGERETVTAVEESDEDGME